MTDRLRVALTPGSFSGRPATFARPAGDGVVLGVLVDDLADAEVALFPFELGSVVRAPDDLDRLRVLVAANAASGRRTVMHLVHDHVEPLDVGQPDAVVLRTSMIAGRPYVAEYAMPVSVAAAWADECPTARAWTAVPVVGFMGQAGPLVPDFSGAVGVGAADMPRREYSSVFRTPVNIGRPLRARALAGLAASDLVRSDIVVRDVYFGVYGTATQETMRQQFFDHLRGSDYVLCVRGAGNFSIRLFETMAMGRVPVIVESDLVLPCADVVDWDAIAVRVPLAQIDRVAEHVAVAHAQGPERFAWRQEQARSAWERWLRMDGFARYVADVIVRGGRG